MRLEQGDPTLTNSNGLFRIKLPGLVAGVPVRLLVEHTGHFLYRPFDGRLNLPAPAPPGWLARITELHLLPLGDLRLLEGARMKLAIEQIKRDALDQIRPDGSPDDIDFTGYLRDLGAELGFSLNDVERAMDDWKSAVRDNPNSGDYELGLLAVANKEFDQARKLFRRSRMDHQRAMRTALAKAERLAQAAERHAEQADGLRELALRDAQAEGNAASLAYRFDDALDACPGKGVREREGGQV